MEGRDLHEIYVVLEDGVSEIVGARGTRRELEARIAASLNRGPQLLRIRSVLG